jgi:AcrR family transcriptional regulator
MARIVKEEEYAIKRKEILDVAQRMVFTKGYQQMTIQDILIELKISKGAFYHYFASKQELLEGLIERSLQEVEAVLLPIVQDPGLPAIEKLERYFASANRWKLARKDYMLALLRVWYDDNNAIFRQKVQASGVQWIMPMLAEIIHQGNREGSLSTPYPDQVGGVIVSLMVSLGDTIARLLLSSESDGGSLEQMERIIAVFTDSLERVLGASPGSICLIDQSLLKEWFTPVEPQPA